VLSLAGLEGDASAGDRGNAAPADAAESRGTIFTDFIIVF
jgi:hypothetical protein